MRPWVKLLLATLTTTLAVSPTSAADLRVAPSTVEPQVGAKTATITLINDEQRPLKVQIRVMRWSQQGGQETLASTQDVVASPPFVTLKPTGRYLLRLVRTAKDPIAGEESYRLLVDEVPEPHVVQPGTVNFVVRQSIPIFFSDDPRRTAKVEWKLVRDNQGLWLDGHNSGTRRLRLSDLMLTANGKQFYQQPGLVGYILPKEEMRWPVNPTAAPMPSGKVEMKAEGDTGPIDVAIEAAPGK